MERIASADGRIHALDALLRESGGDIADARGHAAANVANALASERERVLEIARQQGHAEGMARAQGEIESAAENARQAITAANAAESERLEACNERARALVRALEVELARMDGELEEVAIQAAYAAVLRMLDAARVERSVVADMCHIALDEYRQRPVVLRVAAEDAAYVAATFDDASLQVEPDLQLPRGHCRLETYKGTYGTSVEERMEALKQAFLGALNGAGGEAK
jgi:flagellar biosynthesis/type III secretory pathway protein FliH